MMQIRTPQHGAPSRRPGFTLVELLVSLVVLGIIMSLLMVALRGARRAGQAGAERQNVNTVKLAVVQFKDRYGFIPPLLRDQVKAGSRRGAVTTFPGPSGTERKFNIYDPNSSVPSIRDPDLADLRRDAKQPSDADERFSLATLPYYLAGACEVRVLADPKAPPIDGVRGPGFMPPNPDGTYKLSAALKTGNPNASSTLAGKADPMVEAGKTSLQLYRDLVPDGTMGDEPTGAEFRNRKGIAYRYYRWLPDAKYPGASGTGAVSDAQLEDYYNIPIAVADWNLFKSEPRIRDAKYAVVLPGEDGAFGDEDIADLAKLMSVSPPPSSADAIRALRSKAAKDNIVEYGS